MIRIDFEIKFKPWNITMAENSEEADLNDLIRRLEALSPEKRDRVFKKKLKSAKPITTTITAAGRFFTF